MDLDGHHPFLLSLIRGMDGGCTFGEGFYAVGGEGLSIWGGYVEWWELKWFCRPAWHSVVVVPFCPGLVTVPCNQAGRAWAAEVEVMHSLDPRVTPPPGGWVEWLWGLSGFCSSAGPKSGLGGQLRGGFGKLGVCLVQVGGPP